jgi:hypothetical protein
MAKKWTVMVYMAADTDDELDGLAVQDLREMEQVGTNDHLNIVVQINRRWPGTPQLYVIEKSDDDSRSVLKQNRKGDVPSLNMADGRTLSKFLERIANDHAFDADHYCLVLWGHAFGLGFGRHHGDPLSLDELKGALDNFADARGKKRGDKQLLELLGINACAMSYVEAAFQLHASARYMVASQISVPLTGWPFESILKRIDDRTEPHTLGRLVVEAYMDHYSTFSDERVSMTLLDLDRAKGLPGLVENVSQALRDSFRPERQFGTARLNHVRNVFRGVSAGDVTPLVDVVTLCSALQSLCEDLRTLEGSDSSRQLQRVHDAAQELMDAVLPVEEQSEPIRTKLVESRPPRRGQGLVVLHARHPELDEIRGLGVFAPFVTNDEDLRKLGLKDDEIEASLQRPRASRRGDDVETGQSAYARLLMFVHGDKPLGWPDLVYGILGQQIGPAVMDGILRANAVNSSDRAEVAQILLAVDSSFNNLDRAMTSAELNIKQHLRQPSAAKGVRGARQASIEEIGRLRLLSRASQNTSNDASKSAKTAPKRTRPKAPARAALDLNDAVPSLDALEKAIATVERATRKTLTHTRFGLGFLSGKPGLGFGDTKPGLGFGDTKAGLGFGDTKAGLGFGDTKAGLGFGDTKAGLGFGDTKAGLGLLFGDDKPGLGLPPIPLLSSTDDAHAAGLTVAGLFRQVGRALSTLEQIAANVERVVVDIADPELMGNSDPAQPLESADLRVQLAFQALQDTSSAVRQTVRQVLAHPVQGFGPASNGLDPETRLALADFGGLNRQTLKLL